MYPYTLSIAAYNSAGEKVRDIAFTYTTEAALAAVLRMNGVQTSVLAPVQGSLEIFIPGAVAAGQTGASFMWDGTANNGQAVASGDYYLQLVSVDMYGHKETLVKDVQVIKSMTGVTVKIFNSAGELVREISGAGIASQLELQVASIVSVGKAGTDITIQYGPGMTVSWDGKNIRGMTVSSGIYEMQVVVCDTNGIRIDAEKSVTVLEEGGGNMLEGIKLLPNPVVVKGGSGGSQKITWKISGSGRANIAIYSCTGDRVRSFSAELASGGVVWDLKTGSGKTAASGIYMVVIRAVFDDGKARAAAVKSSIIRKDNKDGNVN
jgi:hypothetical protein